MQTKTCLKCGRRRQLVYFRQRANQALGLQPWCGDCADKKANINRSDEYINNIGYHCSTCRSMVELSQAWQSLSEMAGISLEDVRLQMRKTESVFDAWLDGTKTPAIETQRRVCKLLDAGTLYERRYSKLRVETFCKKCLPKVLERVKLKARGNNDETS
jgi:hypothetical protein